MGYYDRDEPDPAPGTQSRATNVMSIFVRLVGVVLLVAGLAVAILVLMEAWSLYKYPERIEAFARAVERGSNIDRAISPPRRESAPAALASDEPSSGGASTGLQAAPAPPASEQYNISLSYFFAWFIAIMLILLITRIAMSAIATGGKLALYDTEVKRFARALIEETRKPGS